MSYSIKVKFCHAFRLANEVADLLAKGGSMEEECSGT